MIYHYTTAEILKLILASRKIRFNRTDRVDDTTEARRHPVIQFGKYFYVSCWTRDPDESIPLWRMYGGGMHGVRISLPDYPFQSKRLQVPAAWRLEAEGALFAPLTLQEMFGPDYLIVPMFFRPEMFGGDVEYCDDTVVAVRYARAIAFSSPQPPKIELTIQSPFDLVRLKTTKWAFQREYRFSLFAVPSIRVPPEGPGAPAFVERLPNHSINALLRGEGPAAEFIDVDMSDEAFDQMNITFGPLCSDATRESVRVSVDKYASKAVLGESALTGTVRPT